MFHRFHVFVLPGGPDLSALQAQLLCGVVRDNGGCVVEDPLLLNSIARSLSRKGRKQLVIVTGRSSFAQVRHDMARAAMMVVSASATTGGGMDAHRASVGVLLAELDALMTSNPPVVPCVSHHWVSKSAEQYLLRSARPQQQPAVGATKSPSTTIDALDMAAFELLRKDNEDAPQSDRDAEQPQLHASASPPAVVSTKAACDVDSSVSSPKPKEEVSSHATPPTPNDVQTRAHGSSSNRNRGGGGRGVGFLPVFFTGSYDSTTGPLGAISALSTRQQRSSIKRARGSSSSDSDENDESHVLAKQAVRRGQGGSGRGSRSTVSAEWTDAAVASYAEPVESIVMDPNNAALHRGVRFIDRIKPFVCQRPSVAADEEASIFEDDEAIGKDGGGDPAVTRPTPEASRATAQAATVQLNQPLLTQLAELKAVYQATGDQWRTYAYNRAIGVIKRVPFQVERVEQLAPYPGLGDRILNKVREILSTGSSMKLQVLRATPHVAAIEQFSKIWGVGPSTARRLAQHPSQTPLVDIASLRAAPNLATLMSPVQLAGLRHYEDLMLRIPRAEVEAMLHYVRNALEALVGAKRIVHIDLVVCGSYRRGKPTSGDVDILICDRNSKHAEDGLLVQLVQRLKQPAGAVNARSKVEAVGGNTANNKAEHDDTAIPLPVKTERCGDQKRKPIGLTTVCKHDESVGAVQHHAAFIVEDLTVSKRGMEETHSDSWFGIVQLPDCIQEATCPCAHRGATRLPAKADDSVASKPEPEDLAMASVQDGVAPPPLHLGDRFQSGRHISRRMDIKCYPPQQFPFALLYFTGSDYFNRSMRLYCQKKGWSLSDKDLKPVVRVGGEKVHETSYGVPCHTERDIFDAIGLPYKEPWERDV